MNSFGERLKILRKERNFSQRQFAEVIGLTERAYRNYEINKSTPNFHVLISLADFYDVSLDYLVGRSDNPERR